MRTITTHHTNDANKAIRLEADERDPSNGNASHEYRAHYLRRGFDGGFSVADSQPISFQNGPISDVGVNGITNEVLLAIVIDRLEGFQSSKWACTENQMALDHLHEALRTLEERTKKRTERGVEGTHTV